MDEPTADSAPGTAASGPTASGPAAPGPTASGPGRALVTVYGVFALAATSRAGVQLATKFHQAPLAYLLSAFSAVVYVLATLALARRGRRWHRVATVACTVELVGVLAVGTMSLVQPRDFAHPTVWSGYGSGYGWIPLVLPMVGLWWLRRTAGVAAPPARPGG